VSEWRPRASCTAASGRNKADTLYNHSPCTPLAHAPSLDQPCPALLSASGSGLHQFIGLPRWPMLASNRDPTQQEYGLGKPSNDKGCYALIHSGAQLVRWCEMDRVLSGVQRCSFVLDV